MNTNVMFKLGSVGFALCMLTVPLFAADKYTFNPKDIRHGIVIADTTGKWAYHWPRVMRAQWGSEIVIHCAKNAWGGDGVEHGGHECVPGQPGAISGLQLRSTDNGETWKEEGGFRDRVTGPARL